MISFVIGFLIGEISGIVLMCLLQINKNKKIDYDNYMKQFNYDNIKKYYEFINDEEKYREYVEKIYDSANKKFMDLFNESFKESFEEGNNREE